MGPGISGQWRRRHLLIELPLACVYDSIWENNALRTLNERHGGFERKALVAKEGASWKAGRKPEEGGVG